MSPLQILTEHLGQHDAKTALDAIKAGGWMVVDKGAIGRAQREAKYDTLEAVRMGELKV